MTKKETNNKIIFTSFNKFLNMHAVCIYVSLFCGVTAIWGECAVTFSSNIQFLDQKILYIIKKINFIKKDLKLERNGSKRLKIFL